MTASLPVLNCTAAGSVMVSVLTEGVPRSMPPVGGPRVKVSVWLGPGSERSLPVISWVVCPSPNVSGLVVTPLKAVPATAVPPTVNGTDMGTVGLPAIVTGMLNVPALSLTVSLPVLNCTAGGSVMVSVLTDGLPRSPPPVGVPRVKVSVWLGPGSERSVPVMSWVVCPSPNVSGPVVRPLKSVPSTAVPPTVNGTVTVSLISLTVLLPALVT